MTSAKRLPIVGSAPTVDAGRDTSRPVLLVGFQRHSNLGIGYLASTLEQHGYRVEVLDFELERAALFERVRSSAPLLVGFSLIFQSYVEWFGSLIRYLRDRGIDCHFTMGGHFPSLSHAETLTLIPELDSVVRFEGEHTLLELADRLSTGADWRSVHGIAYRNGDAIEATALRALVEDLDDLPYPVRSFGDNAVLGRKAAPILASRGCARTCSFCSIHMFYRAAPGRVVRTRRPAEVVREMRALHEDHGISVFLFQDDDFPLFGPVWKRWARDFVRALHENDLPGRVAWKINCRADAVDEELFAEMKRAGLYMVYMGLESGDDEGLDVLHKQISVDENVRAVEILKRLGIVFEFGFMLLDPSSTFESVRTNVAFLRRVAGDGTAAVTFGRMVPYDGTPIKAILARQGRLRGDVRRPDYDFLDARLDDFYRGVLRLVDVTGWTHGHRGLSQQLNFAWDEVAVLESLFPAIDDLPAYRGALRAITAESNEVICRVVEDTSFVYSDHRAEVWRADDLERRRTQLLERLVAERDAFMRRNQGRLLETLRKDRYFVKAYEGTTPGGASAVA